MVLFNYASKEITAKIVYYGPGLCGKTTNLQFIYDSLPSNNKSKMLSLATKTDRTLFFDFLPLDLGKIRGMRTKLQLYTVPGQVYYNSTRELVLKGADGVVFVADSQDFAVDANLESLQNLEDNLRKQGVKIHEIPVVMQWNKRDLPNALPVEELENEVNRLEAPSFESVATTGIGVESTLKAVTNLVLTHLIKKYGLEGSGPLVEEEIQVLNPPGPEAPPQEDTVWAEDNVLATTVAAPDGEPAAPEGESVFELETTDGSAEDLPLVQTELVPSEDAESSEGSFDELIERFDGHDSEAKTLHQQPPTEIPLASVEIPLPDLVRQSLPNLDAARAAALEAERRKQDGLVKEITIPLNISKEEIVGHRKLKLKVTIDINLLK